MKNQLDIKITAGTLLKFSLPSVITMVFMSFYSIVDGVFVSRLVGTAALSAVNIIMPVILLATAISLMLGTGGSAIIARQFGEGKEQEARENFSFLVIITAAVGIVVAVLGIISMDPLLRVLGANEAVYEYCRDYAFYTLVLFPPMMLGALFQMFFITGGKAAFSMVVNLTGGILNIVLDYLFIAKLGMGISGAAIATGIGYGLTGVIGIVYFSLWRSDTLYLVKPVIRKNVLLRSCSNGASELVTNLSQSVTLVLFNNIMMWFAGENGVAAVTILLYTQALLLAVFTGYATGTAPLISYNYGKKENERLTGIYRISMRIIMISSILIFVLAHILAKVLVGVFAPKGTEVYDMTVHGFRLFSFCFLTMGVSIYGSSMFTAFSDGKVSAVISFMRTFVFIIGTILILPVLFGINGIWLAIPVAEALGVGVTVYYLVTCKKKYPYSAV